MTTNVSKEPVHSMFRVQKYAVYVVLLQIEVFAVDLGRCVCRLSLVCDQ